MEGYSFLLVGIVDLLRHLKKFIVLPAKKQ